MAHTLKIVISLAVLLAVIIAISVSTVSTLNAASKELDEHLSRIESSISANNWDKATQELSYIQGTWSKTEKTWAMLLDHFEIDNIDTTLSRLSKFIEAKSTPLSLGELAALRQYIEHIPEKESLKLKNIL